MGQNTLVQWLYLYMWVRIHLSNGYRYIWVIIHLSNGYQYIRVRLENWFMSLLPSALVSTALSYINPNKLDFTLKELLTSYKAV